MKKLGYFVFLSIVSVFFLTDCSGSGKSQPKGTLKKVTGKLTNQGQKPGGKTTVVAKTSAGKSYKAKIDAQTGKFDINLPKGTKVAMSVIGDAGKVMKLKFKKNKTVEANQETENWGLDLPDQEFENAENEADLGNVDIFEGEDDGFIEIGDEEGETSPFEWIDSDDDGSMDWVENDDDGDGQDDFDDTDFTGEDDWVEDDSSSGSEDWWGVDDSDYCDFSDPEAECVPTGDDWLPDDICDEDPTLCYIDDDNGNDSDVIVEEDTSGGNEDTSVNPEDTSGGESCAAAGGSSEVPSECSGESCIDVGLCPEMFYCNEATSRCEHVFVESCYTCPVF